MVLDSTWRTWHQTKLIFMQKVLSISTAYWASHFVSTSSTNNIYCRSWTFFKISIWLQWNRRLLATHGQQTTDLLRGWSSNVHRKANFTKKHRNYIGQSHTHVGFVVQLLKKKKFRTPQMWTDIRADGHLHSEQLSKITIIGRSNLTPV